SERQRVVAAREHSSNCKCPHLAKRILRRPELAAWTIVGYGSLSETHPREHATDKRIAFAHSPEDLKRLAIHQTKVANIGRNLHCRKLAQQAIEQACGPALEVCLILA